MSAEQRPNVVWLDCSKHYFELFDKHGVETPRLEELAENGLVFERAFSNSPVCSVARTTLITTCYAPRIGTQYHRRNVSVPLPAGVKMFPQLLREAGYYTVNNAKKDYNAIEPQGVWDVNSKKGSWRNRSEDQPFFYKQTLGHSHEGSLHFDRNKFRNFKTVTPQSSVFVAPYHPQTELFRFTNALYRDRIRTVDQQIGRVLDQLEQDGLLEKTFVFFFGDHGGVLPRSKGYLYESGLHIPLVVRIPDKFKHLLDREWEPGTRTKGFVEFVDFGPTVLKLAGVDAPDAIDGRTFLGPGIAKREVESRDTTLGYADRFDEKYDLVRSIRKGRFKYIRNFQPQNFDGRNNNYRYQMLAYQQWRKMYQDGTLNDVQSQFFRKKPAETLYDLEKDPHEVNNLAGEPAHQATLVQMRNSLVESMVALADLGMFPESFLAEEGFENPTEFGRQHQDRIAALLEIANLQLISFANAEPKLRAALQSDDPWRRYWALNACTHFGKRAEDLMDLAHSIVQRDSSPLVQAAAGEFLGVARLGDPALAIHAALQRSKSRIEAAMILNIAMTLRDGYGYTFDIQRHWFAKKGRKDNVERLLRYLSK